MNKSTRNFKRIVSFGLALAMCMSTASVAMAATTDTPFLTQEYSDGSYVQTKSITPNQQRITFFSEDGTPDSSAVVTKEGNTVISIMDTGETVYKVVRNTETEAFQMYEKPSNMPDSAYSLIVESPESYVSPVPSRYTTYMRFGECFRYDYYEFNDGFRQLVVNHKTAEAEPGEFLRESKKFLENSIEADDNARYVVYDLIGFIPGGSILANCGHIMYSLSCAGDTSTAIADALVTYALSVASEICKPAKVISALIDSLNLIKNFHEVESSWEKVKEG